ncbi:MAG: ferredoxin [bacterium]|nr:ferredoxin [bacterium]
MRIEVKRDLCIGAGSCVAVAPEVYVLDDEMKAVVTNQKGADEPTIIESAKACPTLAIYIYDDDGKQVFPAVG